MLDFTQGFGFVSAVMAITAGVILSLAWYLHQHHKKHDHLPGPPRDSFWSGHLKSIYKTINAGGIMEDYFLEVSKTYGPLFRINMWHQTFVLVLDPEGRKEVLVMRNLPKSTQMYSKMNYLLGQRFVGQGLESDMDKERWIKQRMHFDPWFKMNNMQNFTSELNEYGDRIVNQMDKFSDGQTEVPMSKIIHNEILRLLFETGFKFELKDLEGDQLPFIIDISVCTNAFPKVLADPLFFINPKNWRFCLKARNATADLRKYVREKMEIRREAKRKGEYIPDDLHERILSLSDKDSSMREEILLDNYVTFLIGGHETTGNAMCFMIFLLGNNPDCYEKLQKEIDTNIETKSVITVDDFKNLPYLDMVFKETLRMYPVGSRTARFTPKEMTMNGYTFPAGTHFLISHYTTSRLEKYVTDPMKFIPERFDPNDPRRIDRYASTPFSVGPHTCIAKNFAVLKAKFAMVKMLQKYDFDLVPGQPTDVQDRTTLRLSGGALCFVRQRKSVE